MTTLVLTHDGATTPHKVSIAGWEPVLVEGEAGVVHASAQAGNVLLRIGSPGPDHREEVAVHEGELRDITVDGPLYARAFIDRPVGDY